MVELPLLLSERLEQLHVELMSLKLKMLLLLLKKSLLTADLNHQEDKGLSCSDDGYGSDVQ